MSTSSKVSNIVIEPVDALYGAKHRSCFTATVATALDTKYFLVSSTTEDFYVWYDGGGSDPAVAGKTGIAVPIVGTETAVQVAVLTAATVSLLNTTYKLNASVNGDIIVIESALQGAPLSVSAAGTSVFVVAVARQGFSLALGYLDGDVQLGLEEQLFDITAHQTGTQLLGQLRTGVTAGPITLTLKEATVAKLKDLMENGIAVAYTPAQGLAPTSVTAVGALAGSKQFGNVTEDGGSLVLHPTKNTSTDYSGDLCFWLAYPKLNSVTFSGESNKAIEVEFNIFLDESKVNEASMFVYGNHTQNYLKVV